MTQVYFIRHAESDLNNRDSLNRPLTEKGMADLPLVTKFLSDKRIEAVLASTYKRAVDTVKPFAESAGLGIRSYHDLREWESGEARFYEADYIKFFERVWEDFRYTAHGTEPLADAQERNIAALNNILTEYNGKNIVIGTHGMALSLILNHYDPKSGFGDFMAMVNINPWAAVCRFEGLECKSIERVDLFKLNLN